MIELMQAHCTKTVTIAGLKAQYDWLIFLKYLSGQPQKYHTQSQSNPQVCYAFLNCVFVNVLFLRLMRLFIKRVPGSIFLRTISELYFYQENVKKVTKPYP